MSNSNSSTIKTIADEQLDKMRGQMIILMLLHPIETMADDDEVTLERDPADTSVLRLIHKGGEPSPEIKEVLSDVADLLCDRGITCRVEVVK